MHDLSDVTFTIPIKIDQPDRVRNLKICLNYLTKHFDTKITVCEMDTTPKAKDILKDYSCKYIFMKTDSQYFHRTMMLNYMAKNSETPIVVNYDCDILLPIENYITAVNEIRNLNKDVIYPYDGNFYNINPSFIGRIAEENSISFVTQNMCNNLRPAGDSVGGAVVWSKEKFFSIGLENENFISWGFEDTERFERAKKLELRIGRCNSPLIHLHHSPSLNSANGSHPFYKRNEMEWLKVQSMSKDQLKEYINSWNWAKGFFKWTK
jgi:hypothetical protein